MEKDRDLITSSMQEPDYYRNTDNDPWRIRKTGTTGKRNTLEPTKSGRNSKSYQNKSHLKNELFGFKTLINDSGLISSLVSFS